MRLSELFSAHVVDREGKPVGKIHDVRFVKDGPVQGAFGPAYRLEGLIVGQSAVGTRLGFDRGDVKGPVPLKALFRWLHSSALFVDWAVVESVEDETIRLKVARADLRPVPPLRH